MSIKLFCIVGGTATLFSVVINRDEAVGDLGKKAIKAEKQNDLADLDADKPRLWKVNIQDNLLPRQALLKL